MLASAAISHPCWDCSPLAVQVLSLVMKLKRRQLSGRDMAVETAGAYSRV